MKKVNTTGNINNLGVAVNNNNDNYILLAGIQKLAEESTSFQFLIDDENIYTTDDNKEKY